MSNFITNGITYEGKNFLKAIIAPMFIGKSPFETQGIRVMADVTSKINLFIWGAAKKVLKKYVKGFNAANGTAVSKRTIDVTIMKAEMVEDGMEFYDTVYEILLAKGFDINDVSKAGPEIKNTVEKIFSNAIESDLYRQFWHNDTAKETVVSGVQTGVEDFDYSAYDGLWKLIFTDASLTPSATQIKRFSYASSAVKQVQTATMTGGAGSANVVVEGVNYLATFNASLTQTNADFVALHAAALLLRGFVVTSSVADLIFTSTVPGSEKGVITVVTVATMAGTVAQTTANTASSALAADATLGLLKKMYTSSPVTLRSVPNNQKIFQVDGYSYENFLSTIEGYGSTVKYTSEKGRMEMINGVATLFYRGIRVMNLDWENDLNSDFPHVDGELPALPYRIIYTALNNEVMAVDSKSATSRFKSWFDEKEEENCYRATMKTGANYVLPQLMSVAY